KHLEDMDVTRLEPLPGEWDSALDSFQNLLVLRCLRADRLTHGLQDFVASQLGQNFIEPQVPTHIEVMKFSKKMSTISLGQGQGPSAEAMMHSAMEKGQWVFFQNCHLAPSWMPSLERLIENIDPDKVHRDFRLWLGSLPNNKFPVSILQNGSKMTIVPPRGIKANLLRTYASLTDDFIISCTKVPVEKKLSSCLCVFSLEFTDGDLHICISQLKMFLDEYQNIPYKAKPDNYYSDYSANNYRSCLMHTLFSPLHIKIIEEIVKGIVEKIPSLINVQEGVNKYPVMYEESMNTVLVQEVIRYNKLLSVISRRLSDLVKALKGLVVMSSELELISNSLFINAVPELWKAKPLASWVSDLVQRISFLQNWISDGIPAVFWISGCFFPQAFLTGALQNFACSSSVSIDIIAFDFKLTEGPEIGCFVHGLYLEGARWDAETGQFAESRPKELYKEMAVIWMVPVPNRKPPQSGIYVCPIYKTLTRAGTLSTTGGHSPNYVIAVELPTDRTQGHWVKQGVALICDLDY
uniref:Dynein heavy chain C-terminal domain-containing protein n=1 Tax=Sinocyclocheilus grahami TaxID=75366 RepID=A0A672RMC2_SINGR